MKSTTIYSQIVRDIGVQYKNCLDEFVRSEMKRRSITKEMLNRYVLTIDKHEIKTEYNKISQTIEMRLKLKDEP